MPDDLAAGLAAAGARSAFDALPPSHRRELQRYIDDARTPATRAKRIQRPLWTCPECGNRFATRNQYHSCVRYSLTDVFDRRPPQLRALFDALHAVVRSLGPVSLVCYRDRVAFMVRARFAAAVPRRRWLNLELWLPRRVDSPRFARVETLYPNAHIHTLRLQSTADLDGELRGWLAEAYAVGVGNTDAG